MYIDEGADSLLIHYKADTDWLNYKVHIGEERRYDYVQSDISFKPIAYDPKCSNTDYGNLFYLS